MLCRCVVLAWLAAGLLPAVARPTFWMIPPGAGQDQSFRVLFTEPDAWAEARHRVDGIGFFANRLKADFGDAELRQDFAMIRRWHLRFGLEMSALKAFAPTAEASLAHNEPILRRLGADGAVIGSIAFDEPLQFVMRRYNHDPDYAAAEVGKLLVQLRRAHPGVEIGDIEPLPGNEPDAFLRFADGVNAAARAAGVRGLDFLRVDPNWGRFVYGERLGDAGWRMIARVQEGCRARGMRFSLIHIASDLGPKQKLGQATALSWEEGALFEAAQFRKVGNPPDEVVVESWQSTPDKNSPEPEHTVPDSEPGTFTHAVIAVSNLYAEQAR